MLKIIALELIDVHWHFLEMQVKQRPSWGLGLDPGKNAYR